MMVPSKNAECYGHLCGMPALEHLLQHRQAEPSQTGSIIWSIFPEWILTHSPRAFPDPHPGGQGGEGSWHWDTWTLGGQQLQYSFPILPFPLQPIPPPNPSQLFSLFLKTVLRVGRKEFPLLFSFRRNLLVSISLFHPLKRIQLH